jgi:hypothetical protein
MGILSSIKDAFKGPEPKLMSHVYQWGKGVEALRGRLQSEKLIMPVNYGGRGRPTQIQLRESSWEPPYIAGNGVTYAQLGDTYGSESRLGDNVPKEFLENNLRKWTFGEIFDGNDTERQKKEKYYYNFYQLNDKNGKVIRFIKEDEKTKVKFSKLYLFSYTNYYLRYRKLEEYDKKDGCDHFKLFTENNFTDHKCFQRRKPKTKDQEYLVDYWGIAVVANSVTEARNEARAYMKYLTDFKVSFNPENKAAFLKEVDEYASDRPGSNNEWVIGGIYERLDNDTEIYERWDEPDVQGFSIEAPFNTKSDFDFEKNKAGRFNNNQPFGE